MSNRTYQTTELVGTSPDGVDAAISNAVETAAQSISGIGWFEVIQVRGHVTDGKVAHYQVTLKVGHRLDADEDPAGTLPEPSGESAPAEPRAEHEVDRTWSE